MAIFERKGSVGPDHRYIKGLPEQVKIIVKNSERWSSNMWLDVTKEWNRDTRILVSRLIFHSDPVARDLAAREKLSEQQHSLGVSLSHLDPMKRVDMIKGVLGYLETQQPQISVMLFSSDALQKASFAISINRINGEYIGDEPSYDRTRYPNVDFSTVPAGLTSYTFGIIDTFEAYGKQGTEVNLLEFTKDWSYDMRTVALELANLNQQERVDRGEQLLLNAHEDLVEIDDATYATISLAFVRDETLYKIANAISENEENGLYSEFIVKNTPFDDPVDIASIRKLLPPGLISFVETFEELDNEEWVAETRNWAHSTRDIIVYLLSISPTQRARIGRNLNREDMQEDFDFFTSLTFVSDETLQKIKRGIVVNEILGHYSDFPKDDPNFNQ